LEKPTSNAYECLRLPGAAAAALGNSQREHLGGGEGVTRTEILKFWIATHGPLTPELRDEFLARDELAYMLVHSSRDVQDCIRSTRNSETSSPAFEAKQKEAVRVNREHPGDPNRHLRVEAPAPRPGPGAAAQRGKCGTAPPALAQPTRATSSTIRQPRRQQWDRWRARATRRARCCFRWIRPRIPGCKQCSIRSRGSPAL